jgi:tRNA dimethylallyltransferase
VKQIAIIGATSSGKSDLAISLAQKRDANIFSIDSLSVYKEIDIASAKPAKEDLASVKHFGIDVLFANEEFNVDMLIELYHDARIQCEKEQKDLIIVGGSSFYLRSLLQGLSPLPEIEEQTREEVHTILRNSLQEAYDLLLKIDPLYMQNISPKDIYRIEKMLLLYKASGMPPSKWFQAYPPKPVIKDIDIYNIAVERDILRKRIALRTEKMLASGLLEEVSALEKKYSRKPRALQAIGIKEVFEYFDAKVSRQEMTANIITHTAQLAKRQQTFNRTQFPKVLSAPLETLYKTLE